jgi:carbonic anhydrase
MLGTYDTFYPALPNSRYAGAIPVKKVSEGRERLRQEAGLDDFKLPGIQDNQAPAKALVITCSESAVLSAFVASLDPLCILQNLGGTLPSKQSLDDLKHIDETGWSTVAYALGKMRLRQVVLCGHFECCIAAGRPTENGASPAPEFSVRNDTRLAEQLIVASKLPAPKRASQLWLVEQLLRMDAYLVHRSGYREADVSMHALWFDEDQHQIFAYSRDQRQFVLMDQRDFQRLFEVLRADREKV